MYRYVLVVQIYALGACVWGWLFESGWGIQRQSVTGILLSMLVCRMLLIYLLLEV